MSIITEVLLEKRNNQWWENRIRSTSKIKLYFKENSQSPTSIDSHPLSILGIIYGYHLSGELKNKTVFI